MEETLACERSNIIAWIKIHNNGNSEYIDDIFYWIKPLCIYKNSVVYFIKILSGYRN